jgi:hypothetical protein
MSMNWKEFETARSFSALYLDNNDNCLNSADRHRYGFQKFRAQKLFSSQDVIRCDLNSHGPYDRCALDVNRADGSSACDINSLIVSGLIVSLRKPPSPRPFVMTGTCPPMSGGTSQCSPHPGNMQRNGVTSRPRRDGPS